MKEVSGGSNLAVTGSGSASASNETSPAANAFDSNQDTNWLGSPSAGAWIKWDFGSGNAKDIAEVTIINGNAGTNVQTSLAAGSIEYSDNAAAWSLWATFAGRTSASLASTVHVEQPPAIGTLSLSAPTPLCLAYGGANIQAPAPMAGLSIYGGASALLSAPAPKIFILAGGGSAITAPTPTLLSTGRSSAGDNDFTYTAPSALLSAHGGANARLTAPSPALGVTATFTNWGKSDISAPSATLAAAGTVSGTGQAALTLRTPYKLVGYSGAVASITLTGKYTVQAQSTAGSVGGAAITCPLFELSASGTAQNYGSANLLAPAARLGAQAQAWLAAPGFTLTAIGSATITATYEAYAVNLLHPPAARGQAAPVDETTRYTNFPFTHVVRYRNSYYGANSTGLYLLEGTTDDGVDIPYTLRTAISDFKSPFRKTVASAYFGGRLGPDATMTLYAGEGAQTQAYSYTTPRGALAQNYRQAFGKGIRQHRYYSLGISGTDAMALDSLELDTHNSTRRI